jgi:hypothetical protein
MLGARIGAFVAAKPFQRGEMVGRVMTGVVLAAVALVSGLKAFLQSAGGSLAAFADEVARILKAAQLKSAVRLAERAAPTIVPAGTAASAAFKEAAGIYQELRGVILPYRRLRSRTLGFNERVRTLYGYSKYDIDYVKLRLDAHHIVEDEWFAPFASEFRAKLGWQTAEDMDAIALHTEWHIRSGKGLAGKGLQGAEKEPSLSAALRQHLADQQRRPDGTTVPFKSAKEVVEAHRSFYQNYSRLLWERLSPWFDEIISKL